MPWKSQMKSRHMQLHLLNLGNLQYRQYDFPCGVYRRSVFHSYRTSDLHDEGCYDPVEWGRWLSWRVEPREMKFVLVEPGLVHLSNFSIGGWKMWLRKWVMTYERYSSIAEGGCSHCSFALLQFVHTGKPWHLCFLSLQRVQDFLALLETLAGRSSMINWWYSRVSRSTKWRQLTRHYVVRCWYARSPSRPPNSQYFISLQGWLIAGNEWATHFPSGLLFWRTTRQSYLTYWRNIIYFLLHTVSL